MRKRTITTLIALTMCSLCAFGQSNLIFPISEHNFGSIREDGGKVTHRFEGINQGKSPEVILSITTTCGCTTPHYSRKPILPGENFSVEVTFDPLGRPGPFEKVLVLFNAERKVAAELRVRGEVIPRLRSVEEIYPIALAEGVRLTNNFLAIGNLPQGHRHTLSLGVINNDSQPHRLTFINKERSGYLHAETPEVLQAGEEGTIRIEYFVPIQSGRYGTIRDRMEFALEGKSTGIPFTVEALVVDAPEQVIGEWGSARAMTDTQIVKLGEQGIQRGIIRGSFELRNAGGSDLIIRAVECSPGIGCSLHPGDRLTPHRALRAEVTLDSHRFDYGTAVGRITLVTNDPENPVRRVRISAILIEE